MYIGSWKIDDALTFYANTTRFDTGAATDADSVPTYRVYEDETGTPLLTGSMALLDSSNTAGFYSEQITLSAANGFEKGKCYSIYIAATVNSVAGATHKTFQMEAEVDANAVSNIGANVITASAIADGAIDAATFASGAITATVIATGAIDADAIADNAIDAGAIADNAIDTATFAAGTTIPRVTLADTLTTYTGNTPQTGDVFPLASTEIADIKAKTDNLPSDPADASDIAGAFSTVNTTLATIAGYIDTEVGTIITRLGTPSDLGSGATVAANLVDIEAQTDDIGAAGAGLTALATQASVNTIDDILDTEIPAILAAVDTEIAAIKAKTDNLPSDPADQSALEAAILAAWTTALTESYNTDGSPPTPAQALFVIMQRLTEFSKSGATITAKKLDGSTTAFTLTLDDATNPTSSTRAS